MGDIGQAALAFPDCVDIAAVKRRLRLLDLPIGLAADIGRNLVAELLHGLLDRV